MLPGLVSNVSSHGLFVQLGPSLIGLVAASELHGPPPPLEPPASLDAPAPPPAAPSGSYDVAQRVDVRVLALYSAAGEQRVNLSVHTRRLNPDLDSAAQLAGAERGRVAWGRVLVVDEGRALVSLELARPLELPRPQQLAAAGVSMRSCLAAGQVIAVSAAVDAGGAPTLEARLAPRAVAAPPPSAADGPPRAEKRSWESDSEGDPDGEEEQEGAGAVEGGARSKRSRVAGEGGAYA